MFSLSAPEHAQYLVTPEELAERLAAIDPRAYDRSRNHLHGAVTWLSPFLTHGILDTGALAEAVLARESPQRAYRFLFELAWREFFHRTWQLEGDDIFADMHGPQTSGQHNDMPQAIVNGQTGIVVLDTTIQHLLEHGVMHNHARLWVAALSCNVARTWWPTPSRWLHYHLLDGDLASNTLSWQWVAGTFSHKRYLANQQNIDKYSGYSQPGSWLDVSYDALENLSLPEPLQIRTDPVLASDPPVIPLADIRLDAGQSVALRSVWNLDPGWHVEADHQLCFLDLDLHKRWPMSPKRWAFIEHWARQCNSTLVGGSLSELTERCRSINVVRREYPACDDWPGTVQSREWLYPLPDDEFPSFSKFWKAVRSSVGL